MTPPLRVLFVAAELTPIAKVGGLGDVIGALPKNLKSLGVDVRIVIPKYGVIDEKTYPLTLLREGVEVPFDGRVERCRIFQTPLPGSQVPVYLIDHERYLGGGSIYFEKDASSSGAEQECSRFTFFSCAVLELFAAANFWPDLLHCHDWQVGLLPTLVRIRAKDDDRVRAMRTILTINNIAYQGRYHPKLAFRLLGLRGDEHPLLAERTGKTRELNYLQQAILASDVITTVSPTYAKEILTPAYGEGLERYLAKRKDALTGILNGIDTDRFNPATDPSLPARYSVDDLSGKATDTSALQKILDLPQNPTVALLGFVGRLTDQKGTKLLPPILDALMKEDVQLTLLGTGTERFEEEARAMARRFPDRIAVRIAFDAALAQKIYAGADLFLMPSRFEPCGLAQMIAMRYGAVPIVRATGGLKDTVPPFDPHTGQGTGFIFDAYEPEALWGAVEKALALFRRDPDAWHRCQENGMRTDFSWEKSSREYLKLYEQLRGEAAPAVQ